MDKKTVDLRVKDIQTKLSRRPIPVRHPALAASATQCFLIQPCICTILRKACREVKPNQATALNLFVEHSFIILQ
jgi:hypothetical protein